MLRDGAGPIPSVWLVSATELFVRGRGARS
jgi:hypothetical protein